MVLWQIKKAVFVSAHARVQHAALSGDAAAWLNAVEAKFMEKITAFTAKSAGWFPASPSSQYPREEGRALTLQSG